MIMVVFRTLCAVIWSTALKLMHFHTVTITYYFPIMREECSCLPWPVCVVKKNEYRRYMQFFGSCDPGVNACVFLDICVVHAMYICFRNMWSCRRISRKRRAPSWMTSSRTTLRQWCEQHIILLSFRLHVGTLQFKNWVSIVKTEHIVENSANFTSPRHPPTPTHPTHTHIPTPTARCWVTQQTFGEANCSATKVTVQQLQVKRNTKTCEYAETKDTRAL